MSNTRTSIALNCLLLLSSCQDLDASDAPGSGTLAGSRVRSGSGFVIAEGIDAGGYCGDGVVQADEECDPGDGKHPVVSDGSRNLPEGTQYDEWNCNQQTCKRRYIYTPCTGVGWDVESCPGGFCNGTICQPLDDDSCKAWGIDNPVVNCRIEGQWHGICGLGRCFPLCETEADCPQNSMCAPLYQQYSGKVCQ